MLKEGLRQLKLSSLYSHQYIAFFLLACLTMAIAATLAKHEFDVEDTSDKFLSEIKVYHEPPNSQQTAEFLKNNTSLFKESIASSWHRTDQTETWWYLIDLAELQRWNHYHIMVDKQWVEKMSLYVVHDGQITERNTLSASNHDATTPFLNCITLTFTNKNQDVSQLLVKIDSTTTHAPPVTIQTEQAFNASVLQAYTLWGGLVAVLILVALFSTLVHLEKPKHGKYLIFALHIFCILLAVLSHTGIASLLLSTIVSNLINDNILFINAAIILSGIWMIKTYFVNRQINSQGEISLIGAIFLLSAAVINTNLGIELGGIVWLSLYGISAVWSAWLIMTTPTRISIFWRFMTFLVVAPVYSSLVVPIAIEENIIPYNTLIADIPLVAATGGVLLMALLITKREFALQNQQVFSVTHDTETRLPGVGLLALQLNELINERQPFTLILFEPDHLHKIKQSFSMSAYTDLMHTLCGHISDGLVDITGLHSFEVENNKPIKVARASSDIFAAILVDEHREEELIYVVLTIQELLSQPIPVENYRFTTSCAAGAISYPENQLKGHELLAKAKHSLMMAKDKPNQWLLYQPSDEHNFKEQLELAADLQQAIENDEIEVWHQPLINLKTEEVFASEALVRWKHRSRGIISPAEFIPLAETTGLINQLTEQVISKSLEQLAMIQQWGFSQTISINISAKDLTHRSLIPHIITVASEHDVSLSNVIIELTESAMVDDSVRALRLLNDLKEIDVKVAIDDYGTGYSSLEYLCKLPFHELKIDKSFVTEIVEAKRNRTITRATIEMAKHLGAIVVAEGIETKEIEELLLDYGCDYGQGYFYSRPLPVDQYIDWLINNRSWQQNKKQNQQLKHIAK